MLKVLGLRATIDRVDATIGAVRELDLDDLPVGYRALLQLEDGPENRGKTLRKVRREVLRQGWSSVVLEEHGLLFVRDGSLSFPPRTAMKIAQAWARNIT